MTIIATMTRYGIEKIEVEIETYDKEFSGWLWVHALQVQHYRFVTHDENITNIRIVNDENP